MNPRLYLTDDNGIDHHIGGNPKLINMNSTEWWTLQEMMTHQDCIYSSSGYAGSWETSVEVPSGDKYIINEYMEHTLSVEKI